MLAHKNWMKQLDKSSKKLLANTKYLKGWARKDFVTHDRYVYKRVIQEGDGS